MQKAYLDNKKSTNKNKQKLYQNSKIKLNSVVDINILLNRVKINEKKEIKKKILFFSFITLAMSLFLSFIIST